MSQPRVAGGKFGSQYKERRGDVIAVRLPQSLDRVVREMTGNDSTKIKTLVEEALRLKLEHDGFLPEKSPAEASSQQQLEQGQLSGDGSSAEEPATTTSNETPASGRLNTGRQEEQAGDTQAHGERQRRPTTRTKARKATAS